MSIELNSGYDLLASVSEDAIEYIADAIIFDSNHKQIKLRNPNGTPNLKSCMYTLGFNVRFLNSGEAVLSEEKEVRHRIPQVLVRHPTKLNHVQFCKLHAGKRRPKYEPPEQLDEWLKNISFSEGIMHVVNDRESFNIEEYGNEF